MPKSRTRVKASGSLKGIPASVLARAPADWSGDKRAVWCRFYMDGFAGRAFASSRRGSGANWQRAAHRAGQAAAKVSTAQTGADLRTADHDRRLLDQRDHRRRRAGERDAAIRDQNFMANAARLLNSGGIRLSRRLG